MKYVEIEKKVIEETADKCQKQIWIDSYPNEEGLFYSLKQREDTSLCILLLNIDILENRNYDMAKIFNEQYPDMIVLFVSNREELVFQAFEYKPFWFVRRGKVKDELNHVIEKAFEELERRMEKQTVIKCSEGRIRLAHKDILYLEIVHRKVFIPAKQRAKRTCLHVHLATAARVKYPIACCGVFDLSDAGKNIRGKRDAKRTFS